MRYLLHAHQTMCLFDNLINKQAQLMAQFKWYESKILVHGSSPASVESLMQSVSLGFAFFPQASCRNPTFVLTSGTRKKYIQGMIKKNAIVKWLCT